MLAVVASIPIIAVLVLMIVARWSAATAGVTAAVAALAVAYAFFGFGGTEDPFTQLEGFAGVIARAVWVALTVMLIIGPALAIHHLQLATGATATLEAGLARLTPDPRVAALLIVWFFTLFIEGAAGFGTPVALAAPFLVAAGFKPVAAVTAALVGHTAGVTFGAVGTPTLAQATLSGESAADLAWVVAPYQVVVGVVLAIVVARLVGTLMPTHGTPWAWMAVAYVMFFVPFTVIAWLIGPELPALAGALVGAVGFVAAVTVVRRVRPNRHVPDAEEVTAESALVHAEQELDHQVEHRMGMLRAAAPYLVLVVLVLATRLIPEVQAAARSVTLRWEMFGAFEGDIQPLYHPGLLLIIAWAVGGLIQRSGSARIRTAAGTAIRQLGPVFVALVAMVTVAFTMSSSGMTEQLALTAAATAAFWPLLAPSVGALGTFMTGSATASNILFTDFQMSTADAAGFEQMPLLGAQNSGASIGGIVAPHNVVAAAATVGLSGREGEVLRQTLPIAGVCLLVAGVFAWLVCLF